MHQFEEWRENKKGEEKKKTQQKNRHTLATSCYSFAFFFSLVFYACLLCM